MMNTINFIRSWEGFDTIALILLDIILVYIAIYLIKKNIRNNKRLISIKGKVLIFDEYEVTFDYKKNKCTVKRLDGVRINTSSEQFIREFREIRRTEEYEINYKLMNLNYSRRYSSKTRQRAVA